VIFDLPNVIEQASAISSDRLRFEAGNFFEDSLPVCDAYMMKAILHDWSDQEAAQILRAVRRFAPTHAKLLLAEFLLPDDNDPSWTLFVDLIMLGELTGKERSQTEFGDLLGGTGFRLDRVIATGFNTFLLEASVI
jgi:O-methyltransferase domain